MQARKKCLEPKFFSDDYTSGKRAKNVGPLMKKPWLYTCSGGKVAKERLTILLYASISEENLNRSPK